MFLLFLTIILLIICLPMLRSYNDAICFFGIVSGASAILTVMTLIIITCSAVGFYPDLVGKKEFLVSLKSEIGTIRDAKYINSTNGTLVSGSIENIQQSTNLSKYISTYATHKANYNDMLAETKVYKTSPVLKWFWNGIFIDKRILELQRVE